jgi:hypothetical protein
MAKQRVFLANTKLISTITIAGSHIAILKIGFTLCQVLMAIKSIDFPGMGLFIAIDENFVEGSYTVLFTVHKDRYKEANSLVPLLCIILEAKFGQCVWEWFTDDARRVLTKYTWNASEERAVLIHPEDDNDGMDLDSDDKYMKSICDMLNIDEESGGNGFDFDINFVIEEAGRPTNQYRDSGSVKTFRDTFDKDEGTAAETNNPTAHLEQVALSDPPQTHPSPANKVEKALELLLTTNPDLVKKVMATIPLPVSPMKEVDGD